MIFYLIKYRRVRLCPKCKYCFEYLDYETIDLWVLTVHYLNSTINV